MRRYVAKALCGLVTARQPSERTLENPLPEMAHAVTGWAFVPSLFIILFY
jgi:hypothetical protein